MKQDRRKFLISTSLFTFGWFFYKQGGIFANYSSFATEIESGVKNHSSDYSPQQSVLSFPFEDQFPYSLPKLSYPYDALEPYIDKQTMEIHHTKHHQTYINNLNKALDNQTYKHAPLIELFKKVSTLDKSIRDNGGGHFNHTLFWQMLKPNPHKEKNMPSDNFQKIINQNFDNFENFKTQFSEKALKIFGSGWCWLIIQPNKALKIVTTANQDNPLMDVIDEKDRGYPLLGLDVWEHAYYLKYQNRRAEYIENWWHIIQWEYVEKLYTQFK